MSTLILKGSILNFVAHTEDESILHEILEFCIAKANAIRSPDGMPPEVVEELREALLMSYDEKNLTSHEDFKQERAQWLTELRGSTQPSSSIGR